MRYLDWASTSPPNPDFLREAAELAVDVYGNPSSPHGLGKSASAKLEEARRRLAKALGSSAANRLVFTGSGTEADGIPLLALLRKARTDRSTPHLLVSEIEHSAIYEEARVLAQLGLPVSFVRPNSRGILSPEEIRAELRPETELVAVMAVNNETGAVQPIADIASMLHDAGKGSRRKPPALHVDAVQALGKIDFRPEALGVSTAAFSAHKIRGPRGVGALWHAGNLEPLVVGGGQEGGLRPGTESLQGAWAFSLAAERSQDTLLPRQAQARNLETRLIEGLERIGARPLPLGRTPGDPSYSPFILSAAFPGLSGEVLARALADGIPEAPEGIAVSTGAACSTHARKKGRRILEAMGLAPDLAFSAIRISPGELTSPEDIDVFLAVAGQLYRKLRT